MLEWLFRRKNDFPSRTPVHDHEDKLEEYWAFQKFDTITFSASEAVSRAYEYLAEKKVSHLVESVGEPKLANNQSSDVYTVEYKSRFLRGVDYFKSWMGMNSDVPTILQYTFPGEYAVPIKFMDDKGASYEVLLYVSSQSGNVRDCYSLTLEQVTAKLARSREYYLLAFVGDGESAAARAQELFAQQGVLKVVRGRREYFDAIQGMAAFGYLREGSCGPGVEGELEVLVKEGYKDNLF